MKTIKPTKWATVDEIRAARERWPYGVRDAVHVDEIRRQTGLSENAAREALAILRGDSEGDVVELDAARALQVSSRTCPRHSAVRPR